MCGINGIFSKNHAGDYYPNVQRMNNAIRHRGPDDEGIYQDRDIVLGHRRLSIIDLSKHASQPMTNKRQTLWVVFNGEIYNFPDLRQQLESKGHTFFSRSDTEILLHGYEEWGEQLFNKLEGMFAFGLWDKEARRLFLVRDGCGIKPIFYVFDDQKLVFSSEIKGLLASNLVERSINPQSLSNYLSLFYVPHPETILEHVKQVPPGSFLIFSVDSPPKTHTFWDIKQSIMEPASVRSEDQLYEQLREEVSLTVKNAIISDVPISLLLSSGIDSSILLCELKQLGHPEIETVTVGFKEASYDESHIAQQYADESGFINTSFVMDEVEIARLLEKIIYHQDSLNGNPCIFAEYFCYQQAAQKGKVTLLGSGNDELFAGYSTYLADEFRAYYALLPHFLKQFCVTLAHYLPVREKLYSLDYVAQKFTEGSLFHRAKSHYWWRTIFSDSEKRALLKPDFLQKQEVLLDSFYTHERHYHEVQNMVSFEEQSLYTDFYLFLIDNANLKMDQLSMAFSLEARPPFLTKRFVEFAFSLPYHYKRRGRTTKYCLRKSYQHILPKYILQRKKRGLVSPLYFLFKNEFKTFFCDYVFSTSLAECFHLDYIEELLNRHLQTRQNNSYKLFALLVFAIWKKHFIDSVIP